ncbi:putative uncharacterized protein [Alistipes sp. CAG:831]|nr:putative uncharacterized protein [Alistipes sp. CAG:831]
MEANEILTSLANLEASLKEIESAKEQVQKTVRAYATVQKQISDYTKALEAISGSIKGIIADVKSQRTALSDDAENVFATLLAKSDDIISNLNSSVSKNLELLKSALGTTKDSFAKDCSNTIDSLKKIADEEVKKLDERIEELEVCAANLNTLHENIKNTLCKIIKVEKSINDLKTEMLKTQGEQDTILSQIKNSISSLSSELGNTTKEISNEVLSSSKTLNTTISAVREKAIIIDEKVEKTGKKLGTIGITIIILTIINILVSFCSVLIK